MSKLDIYVGIKEIKDNKQKLFKFIAIKFEDGTQEEIFYDVEEATANRALILGISRVLNSLSCGSNVLIHTPTNIGFKFIKNLTKNKSVRKWINKDIGMILAESITENKHKVSFENYGLSEPSELTKSIKSKLKNKFNIEDDTDRPKQVFEFKENVYNSNTLATTDVSIFVRGTCDYFSEDRNGCYYVILNYKGIEKEITKDFKQTTVNRLVIQGVIDAVKLLKKPCRIKLFTHTNLGLAKFNRSQRGVNSDLLKELFDLLSEGNHSIEEVVGMYRQEELKIKVKRQ